MSHRLYIKKIPFTLEHEALESALREVLEAFGAVLSLNLIFEGGTCRPKGLCFVEFATRHESLEALHSLNGLKVLGHRLEVGEAIPRLCPPAPALKAPQTPPEELLLPFASSEEPSG